MEVILHTEDGKELQAVVKEQRGFSSVVLWQDGDQMRVFVHVFDDSKNSGYYRETTLSVVQRFKGATEAVRGAGR